jgi:hypothetical protein
MVRIEFVRISATYVEFSKTCYLAAYTILLISVVYKNAVSVTKLQLQDFNSQLTLPLSVYRHCIGARTKQTRT